MVLKPHALVLGLASLASTALAAPQLTPAGPTVPRDLARYVRVANDAELATPKAPPKDGTWTLTLKGLGAPAADHTFSVEVAPTPSCPHDVAVFYSEGANADVVPGDPQVGLDFSLALGGKHYLVSLAMVDETHFKGLAEDFETQAKTPAEAVFVSTDTKLKAQPVTVSLNMLPFELKYDNGGKGWAVRSPELPVTSGDFVTHPGTPNSFACYLLKKDASELAFAYSHDPVFIILAVDAADKQLAEFWAGQQNGTVHVAADPLPLSITTKDGASLDILPKTAD